MRAPRLYPAIRGRGVRCVCVCLGSGFGCAPPLLAGVLGFVCVCVRALLVPRHSWLGCAASVCVLGSWFRLRPATPGWGVRVCMFVCALCLYPATPGWGVRCGRACLGSSFGCAPPTPGWGVRCGCVCLGSGLGCAPPLLAAGVAVCVCLCVRSACTPPLLAGVFGVAVCAWAQVWAAPRHFWLGCWGVRVCVWAPLVPRHSWLGCAVWACVLELGFRLRPATPGRVCGVGVCPWARVSAAPRHSWLGCWASVFACVRAALVPRHSWLGSAVWACVLGLGFWLGPASPWWVVGVCMFVCALRLYPATPGGDVQVCVFVCALPACTPPFLAGVCGVCVCALARVSAAPRNSWLGCAVWVCVLGLGFRLRPATPGWGDGQCVCLCVRSACTPPLLAGVFGVAVCAWAQVWAAPRHSWLGCSGVCVCVRAPRLYPAIRGRGVRCVCVCLGSGFGCAPPLLAGVLGFVCVCVRALPVPRHSWLGCAAWVCVLGSWFRLRPATPGWGVRVCMFVCALCLYPATPGWGVRCGRACLGSSFGCAPPTPGWGVRCGCVCLGSGLGCAPPLLVGVLLCVCACVCAPLVPRHSWLGCLVWLCVLGLRFGLRPATSGWGVGVCVFVCALPACTLPLLAWVCGVGVRA